tara:strand:+ start:106245 stop:106535 length:291 start_codon:yes stop_codon:yes gene_type:complete
MESISLFEKNILSHATIDFQGKSDYISSKETFMDLLNYILVTVGVLAVVIAGMALGVIFSNKPLKGSCGGLGRIMGDKCDYCGKADECKNRKQAQA